MSTYTPNYTINGHEFYSLYVADATHHENGWRDYIVEIDGRVFSVTFAPCDWRMHPRGKNMTYRDGSRPSSLKYDTGIREAVRLHNRSIEVYEAALSKGKTPQEAKALSQFEAIYRTEAQA